MLYWIVAYQNASVNQCKCEPFENASVIKTLNPTRRPSFSCLLTSPGPFPCPHKFTFPVVVYIRWNDQGQAFTAVISCTDAHRSISSNRLVCIASEAVYRNILLFEEKRLVSGTTASMLLPMQTKMSNKHCISLLHGLYLVTVVFIKLEFSVAVRGRFICSFLHNPTVSYEFWTIFPVRLLNLQKTNSSNIVTIHLVQ